MTKKIKRREFMRSSAVAGVTLASAKSAISQFPNVLVQSRTKPIVISSANGNRFKNGGEMTAVHKAFTMMTGGSDVLDAVIAHERGEWDEAARIAATLPVKAERLPAAYADSLKWARELTQVAAAA